MKKIFLTLVFLLPLNLYGNTISKNISKNFMVSATVYYDCTKQDLKALKYCNNYVIKQDDKYITIYY